MANDATHSRKRSIWGLGLAIVFTLIQLVKVLTQDGWARGLGAVALVGGLLWITSWVASWRRWRAYEESGDTEPLKRAWWE